MAKIRRNKGKQFFDKNYVNASKKLHFKLDKVQCDLDSDTFNIALREEDDAYVVKGRTRKSRIDVVFNADGAHFKGDQVPVAFISHYADFLGQHGVTLNLNTRYLFTNKFDYNVAYDMVKTVTPQEVKDAIFFMGDDKSPDPDGYTAAPNRPALVLARRISDNILLTQKLMHTFHLDRGPPRCDFKVDIQKAYDMGKRGLRQGNPMSPYLLTLVMEVLTLMLHRQVRESESFTYHRYCSNLDIINLCFADDLFLFSHGDVNSAWAIMEALDEFK
ncbi:polypyrimidine tract-binding protein homolog 2 isoform X1 [Tanacetum coccineum]